jgi:RNA polymerase sigma-70 factor (ECF subfamily)
MTGEKPMLNVMADHINQTRAFDDEEQLARALTNRDPHAWRQLFEEQHARVYRYAYLRLGDASDADDVTSNVFAAAVRGIGGFRYRGAPVAAWIFRIAHHETVDALKRRRRAQSQSMGMAEGTEMPAPAGDPAQRDEWRDVVAAMDALTAEQRLVLTMRLLEGRSVAEVAAATGRSQPAVKMLQRRALDAIRRQLGD